jgi:hypothetical protein
MVKPEGKKAYVLAALALVLWTLYFVVSAAPVGAPFIYAEF